jgi:hypothetical protein
MGSGQRTAPSQPGAGTTLAPVLIQQARRIHLLTQRKAMKSPTKALLTAGLGAVAMYYLDPAQGRKRRDLARDRIEYGRDRLEKASHTARVVGHDVSERADGANVQSLLAPFP